jgi:hypothetical protein
MKIVRTLTGRLLIQAVLALLPTFLNAQPPAPALESALTLGVWSSYPTDRGDEHRSAVFPELRFDGTLWWPIRDRLALPFEDRAASIEAVPGQPGRTQPKRNADLSLAEIARKAMVQPDEWRQWIAVDGLSNTTATRAWPAWAACRSQWALATNQTRTERNLEKRVTSRAVTTQPFVRTPMLPTDPIRAFAVKIFLPLDAQVVEQLRERALPASQPKLPVNVSALRAFPMRWWRSFCSQNSDGGRICQLVARRRFDGRTDERYSVEPVQYHAWIAEATDGSHQVIEAYAATLPIGESWSDIPPEPHQPHAVLRLSSGPVICYSAQLSEGQATCVSDGNPKPLTRKRTRDVCASWGC